jgi:phosphomannomutase/phosphoglucomutase
MYKTGASYTNKEMKEGNFLFGGEYSGHVFFRDKWPGFDDGIYAALRLIEILSASDQKLSDMISECTSYENTYFCK